MSESEGSNQKVRVELPDNYRKFENSDIWEDLEKYLFTGFLTSTTTIHGHRFVFKTLNQYEIRNIDFLKSTKASSLESRASFRSAFIAYSIFIIDGENAIADRNKFITKLIRIVGKLPNQIQDKIIENLSALNERANRLYPLTEFYAYENRSRFKWMQICQIPIHSTPATGIVGTDNLGMNLCQATWVAMNRIIDRRETVEREWSNAKFVGSCFAGKGVRSIDERDRAKYERESSEREEKKLKVLKAYLNRSVDGEHDENSMVLPDGRKAEIIGRFQATSAEELRDQLSAALSGEKDHHDLVIEQKEREHIERLKAMDQNRNLMYQVPSQSQSDGSHNGHREISSSRILGGKQATEAYIARMQELQLTQIQKSRQLITPDQQNSDKSIDGEDST